MVAHAVGLEAFNKLVANVSVTRMTSLFCFWVLISANFL